MTDSPSAPPLIVLSHLRWSFVFQRPQHLLSRAAADRKVLYVEEPIFEELNQKDFLDVYIDVSGVHVCVPHVQLGYSPAESQRRTADLLKALLEKEQLDMYDLWVYTPMELPVVDGLKPRVTVYDCMDELANFLGAPPELKEREKALFEQAHLVFTGGHKLFEAKKKQHHNVHPFPSSVDVHHFARAREITNSPVDQIKIPQPRLGFFGVIDERFDCELIKHLAHQRPEWHFVLIGPVVKISQKQLPVADNIHYLGRKAYEDLPHYLSGWDVALLPFAINKATEFISPTKTPEYLAAGVPTVSTAIHDVVRPYGEQDMVLIAENQKDFVEACQRLMSEAGTQSAVDRQAKADAYLSTLSWDQTWQQMATLIEQAAAESKGV